MTTVATETDTDALDALDFDHDQECTSVRCAAGRPPARWRFVMVCGCVGLACTPCHDYVTAEIAAGLVVARARCLSCGHLVTDRVLVSELYVSIEPLPW